MNHIGPTTGNTGRPFRGGYTLLELIVALTASSFLIAGMGSSIFLASQVLAPTNSSAHGLLAADALHQLSEELKFATHVIQRDSTSIEFVVNDVTDDGNDDRIRYEWSGIAGEPLTRSLNGNTATVLLPTVTNLAFDYVVADEIETFAAPAIESDEVLLLNTYDDLNGYYSGEFHVTQNNWIAQTIQPATFNVTQLPPNAQSWTITRADFRARRNGSPDGELAVRMRRATGDGLPSSDIVAEAELLESDLTTTTEWNTVTFPTCSDLAVDTTICAVPENSFASAPGIFQTQYGNGGALVTSNAGATWNPLNYETLSVRIFGRHKTPATTTESIVRRYLTGTKVALQYNDRADQILYAEVNHLNSPELLTTFWECDFQQDPTQMDVNFDALPDWQLANGQSFQAANLRNGFWIPLENDLQISPAETFNLPTSVDVRLQSTSADSLTGAVFSMVADVANNTGVRIQTEVRLEESGTQQLQIVRFDSSTEPRVVQSVTGLSAAAIDVRLVVLPTVNRFAAWAEGEFLGCFDYVPYAMNPSRQHTAISGDDAAFDFVSIRVQETTP